MFISTTLTPRLLSQLRDSGVCLGHHLPSVLGVCHPQIPLYFQVCFERWLDLAGHAGGLDKGRAGDDLISCSTGCAEISPCKNIVAVPVFVESIHNSFQIQICQITVILSEGCSTGAL